MAHYERLEASEFNMLAAKYRLDGHDTSLAEIENGSIETFSVAGVIYVSELVLRDGKPEQFCYIKTPGTHAFCEVCGDQYVVAESNERGLCPECAPKEPEQPKLESVFCTICGCCFLREVGSLDPRCGVCADRDADPDWWEGMAADAEESDDLACDLADTYNEDSEDPPF